MSLSLCPCQKSVIVPFCHFDILKSLSLNGHFLTLPTSGQCQACQGVQVSKGAIRPLYRGFPPIRTDRPYGRVKKSFCQKSRECHALPPSSLSYRDFRPLYKSLPSTLGKEGGKAWLIVSVGKRTSFIAVPTLYRRVLCQRTGRAACPCL